MAAVGLAPSRTVVAEDATSRAGERATIAGYCAAGPSVCRLGGLRRCGLRRASGLSILAMSPVATRV